MIDNHRLDVTSFAIYTGGSRGGASVSHASYDYKVVNCDIKVRGRCRHV